MQKELVHTIRALLPGTDCAGLGGCGYPSCDRCAEAIAGGGPANRCPACDGETVAAIAALMGRETPPVQAQVAFVKCAGHEAGQTRLRVYASCEEAVKSGFLPGECTNGCVGAGSCAAVCTFGAMTVCGGQLRLDKAKCTGCGACVKACPQHLVHIIPADASNFVPCSNTDEEGRALSLCGYSCIGCGDCAEACPEGAIAIEENHAVIDYEKCVGCVACTVSCRKKIIVDTYHDLARLKDTTAFVPCRGGQHNHAVYAAAGATSCREAVQLVQDGLCGYGCAGFGDCVQVCRFDAISIVQGTAKVEPDRCVGCTACVHICPRELPVLVPYKGAKLVPCASKDDPKVRRELCQVGCTGCGDCVDNCPDGLIRLEEGRAVISPDSCEDCSICSYVCAYGVIAARQMPEFVYVQRRALAAQKGGAAQ